MNPHWIAVKEARPGSAEWDAAWLAAIDHDEGVRALEIIASGNRCTALKEMPNWPGVRGTRYHMCGNTTPENWSRHPWPVKATVQVRLCGRHIEMYEANR